jgi:transcriptional repressor NrdR
MRCPKCFNPQTRVCDSRNTNSNRSVRRRRMCDTCEYRFTTVEEIKIIDLKIEKRSGQVVPFDQSSLERGIKKAFNKRSVSANQINDVIQRTVDDILEINKTPIKSTKIGKLVLKNLKDVDQVAYICYASMFLNFENLDDFTRAVRGVVGENDVD